MKTYDLIIIGAGASGLMAAYAATSQGASVLLVEKHNKKLGQSILRSGNGRCNISHQDISAQDYNQAAFIQALLNANEIKDMHLFIENIFADMGLFFAYEDKRAYPYSFNAQSVLSSLLTASKSYGLDIIRGAQIRSLEKDSNFKLDLELSEDLESEQTHIRVCSTKLLWAAGAQSAQDFLNLSAQEHSKLPDINYIRQEALLCPLQVDNPLIYGLSGLRVKLLCQGPHGYQEEGEILIRDYGLSGILSFNISRELHHHKTSNYSFNFIPGLKLQDVESYLNRRLEQIAQDKKLKAQVELKREAYLHILDGILAPQLARRIIELSLCPQIKSCNDYENRLKQEGWKKTKAHKNSKSSKVDSPTLKLKLEELELLNTKTLISMLTKFKLEIKAICETQLAQLSSGGLDINNLNDNLEHKTCAGLYFSGEVLDVDGPCGGYNLAWAWISGYIAGKDAALKTKKTD